MVLTSWLEIISVSLASKVVHDAMYKFLSKFHIIFLHRPVGLFGAFNNLEQPVELREVFCCVIWQLHFSVFIQRALEIIPFTQELH